MIYSFCIVYTKLFIATRAFSPLTGVVNVIEWASTTPVLLPSYFTKCLTHIYNKRPFASYIYGTIESLLSAVSLTHYHTHTHTLIYESCHHFYWKFIQRQWSERTVFFFSFSIFTLTCYCETLMCFFFRVNAIQFGCTRTHRLVYSYYFYVLTDFFKSKPTLS